MTPCLRPKSAPRWPRSPRSSSRRVARSICTSRRRSSCSLARDPDDTRTIIHGSRAGSIFFAIFCGGLLMIFINGPYGGHVLTEFDKWLGRLVELVLLAG